MKTRKLRKILLTAAFFYTLFVLYFIFLAFNRIDHATSEFGYTFMLIPERVPLLFPDLSDLSFSWVYDLGNIAAFIPFGIIIPMLFHTTFKKFISLFVMTILVLETLQALTFLGSFDVMDVLSNTLGAWIGFCVYRVGLSPKTTWRKLSASGLTMLVLLCGVMVVSEMIDLTIQKRERPAHALHEVSELTGRMPAIKALQGFTIAGEQIKPEINLYSSEGKEFIQYTYILGNKRDVTLYAYRGVPDHEDLIGELIITVDGNDFVHISGQYITQAEPLNIPLDTVNEITITLKGNVKLWDVQFSEKKHWWE